MTIGIPIEVKPFEYRVGLTPSCVRALSSSSSHNIMVETGAGNGSGFTDQDYIDAGGQIVSSAEALYEGAEIIIKVKEPQPSEFNLLKPGQILFCFFHFASSESLTKACLEKRIQAVAFETLFDKHGRLPILAPMSEIAGKLSVQEGAKCLENPMQGRGVLLGGVPGVERGEVLILGGGLVGENAARVASGLGASVMIMDINPDRMRELETFMPPNVKTCFSSPDTLKDRLPQTDLVIGAALIPGKKAPRLLSRNMLSLMKPGSVLVDVAIDQGGCFETSRPTTHQDPTYVVDGIVHYAVPNIPGAVSRTSTMALNNVLLPYAKQLADLGLDRFLDLSHGHKEALNLQNGQITNAALKETFPNLS